MGIEDKKDAFFQVYIRNQKRIYAYILLMVPNVADADDILQKVSSLMWERFDTFELGSNFGAWGIRIARNLIFDHYKSKRRSKIIFTDQNIEILSDKSIASTALLNERIEATRICLGKLPETDRKLVQDRYEKGLKIKDIAHLADRSVAGLYKVFNRIHNTLVQCIRREMLARGIVK